MIDDNEDELYMNACVGTAGNKYVAVVTIEPMRSREEALMVARGMRDDIKHAMNSSIPVKWNKGRGKRIKLVK